MKTQENGFTLIELLVVISIIALLSSLITPSILDAWGRGNDSRRLSDMQQLETAFTQFYLDHNRYPNRDDDGVPWAGQRIGIGLEIDDALRPYIDPVPRDPTHDGSVYYYSYDPLHIVDLTNCSGSSGEPADTPVFGFNKAQEMTNLRKDTCHGGNMNLDDADFNVALD